MQSIAIELEKLLPIDILGLEEDRQRYGFLPNSQGGIIDDLMISNRGDHFFAVINASRKEIDFKYFKENISKEIDVELISSRSLIAIQGPQSEKILSSQIGELSSLNYLDVKNFYTTERYCGYQDQAIPGKMDLRYQYLIVYVKFSVKVFLNKKALNLLDWEQEIPLDWNVGFAYMDKI